MALPTQKRTKSSKRIKTSTFALKKQRLAICAQCKKSVLPHHACLNCGHYNNQEVLKIKTKSKKKK
ncbi:MAG: 50S ribosomal protein L32 [Patescibacteria group bacterium]